MKRIFFIFMIIIVLSVVGTYSYIEFRVPEISFVRDSESVSANGNEIAVTRLYTSGADIDAFSEKLDQTLISAEFTEEEIIDAALASGKPEFFPAFYFNVYRPDFKKDIYGFSSFIRQEKAPGQVDTNFQIANVHLEMYGDGFQISNVKLTTPDNSKKNKSSPVISDDGAVMVVNLNDAPGFSVELNGKAGMVTMNYTYDIISNSMFPKKALEKQLFVIYANITFTDEGELLVEYIREPYSSLEDLE